jgi:hypothetical protein
MVFRGWLLSLLVFCLLAPQVVTAADGAERRRDDATAAAMDKSADPERVRCKRMQVTGSHFPKRICRTRRQWDAMREAASNMMEKTNLETQAHNQNQRY